MIVAVVSNIFLVPKLAKVRTVIKAAGGARRAAGKLRKAYAYDRSKGSSRSSAVRKSVRYAFGKKQVGSAAQQVLLEVLSLDGVARQCF